jgi:hypothetical protein
VHLKNPSEVVKAKIREVSDSFYDLQLLVGKKEVDLTESFMTNEDSTDKLRQMWAFNLPCTLLVNSATYWPRLKPVYIEIFKDLQLTIKRSLAASLIEVSKLHLDEDFMLEVVKYFLICDLEEVKQKIVPNLVEFVKLYPKDKQMDLVTTFIKPQLVSFLAILTFQFRT